MDSGINLHKELAMGKGKAEAQGKKVKMENLGTSLPKAQLKYGGKVSPKKKGKK